MQFMKIIQHEHERDHARAELRGEPRRRPFQRRHARADVVDQLTAGQAGPAIRGRQ